MNRPAQGFKVEGAIQGLAVWCLIQFYGFYGLGGYFRA